MSKNVLMKKIPKTFILSIFKNYLYLMESIRIKKKDFVWLAAFTHNTVLMVE